MIDHCLLVERMLEFSDVKAAIASDLVDVVKSATKSCNFACRVGFLLLADFLVR